MVRSDDRRERQLPGTGVFMTFVSFGFVGFMILVIAAYFLIPKKGRWAVLLVASYLFYLINSEWLVLVLLAETAVTFLIGLWIENSAKKTKQQIAQQKNELSKEARKALQSKGKKRCKRILVLGILVILGTLLFLKYYNFFADTISLLTKLIGFRVPNLRLLLPLGISFYSLQAIAYMTDVYRGKIDADRHFLKFMLFMSYFPQIVQGPIARHKQLAEQLYEPHDFDYDRMVRGFELILWGFIKKMIIADRIAIPVTMVFDHPSNYSGLLVLLAGIGYGIQVYTDFSGGMDIARGFSQIIGIDLELNFRQPYFSESVENFWRRWHITLGAFMRDYVFYPLSLSKLFNAIGKKSRKLIGDFAGKKVAPFIAMFIVYFLVGFWHGAEWKYAVYGIWNGVFIASGILLTDVYAKIKKFLHIHEDRFLWRLFQIVRTFIIISVGRFFSRTANVRTALSMIKSIFTGITNFGFLEQKTMYSLGLDRWNWLLLLAGIILLFVVDIQHEKGFSMRDRIAKQNVVFRVLLVSFAITAIVILGVYGPEYNSAGFIYQQF